MTTKFSQLNNVGVGITGDQLITLRSGLDVLTNYTVPVPLAGGTMTGYLILNADPTNPLGAATKQYVDAEVSGSVTSVTGTSLQIDASPTTGAVVVSIDSGYVGQTSITTLGTIATGVWNGSVIGLSYGGTNHALTASNGGIVWSDASKLNILSGTATAGQLLLSGSSATPAWSTSTYPATNAANTLLYASSSNTMAALATATSAVLTTVSSVPTWASDLSVGLGGTGNTTFTAYSVICAGTTATGAFQNVSGLGTSGYVLTSNGAAALPTWQAAAGGGIGTLDADSGSATGSTVTISGGSTGLTTSGSSATIDLTGTLVVANGGTGIATTTAYAVICGGTTATGAFQHVSGLGSSGYVLTSNGAGALPTWQAGGGGGTGITWNDQTSGTVTMAVNNGYVIDNGASLVTLTLPATAALGSLFIVAGKSAGGWIIDVASGQTIHVGSTASTASTGTVASSNQYDCITLVCVTANTTFVAYGIQGNVVVV